jgi:hypothetical protein
MIDNYYDEGSKLIFFGKKVTDMDKQELISILQCFWCCLDNKYKQNSKNFRNDKE